MNDKQQETDAEATGETETMVAEDRSEDSKPAGKGKRRTLSFLIVLLVLGGGAGAGWYYQSMWLPDAKAWVMAWLPSDEKPDHMAAPMVDEAYLDIAGKPASSYALSAIPDPKTETAPVVVDEPAEQVDVASTADANVAAEDSNTSADTEQATAVLEEVPTETAQVESNTQPMEKPEPVVEAIPAAEPVLEETEVAATEPEITIEATIQEVMPVVENKPLPVATLQQARQAFWSRDLVTAEQRYKSLLGNDASNADAWGELGNLYYLQAKWPQAAKSYAEASISLLDKGDYPRAMYLQYVVRGLDPAQAARIDEKLRFMQRPVKR